MYLEIDPLLFAISATNTHILVMAFSDWPRKRTASLSWQHLSARVADTGERWVVIWDTARKSGIGGRNTAVEKSEEAALDRARHMLRLGFVVYEIRDPGGAAFLAEAEIRARLGLAPALA